MSAQPEGAEVIPASSLRAAIAYLSRALDPQSVSRTIYDPILEAPRTSEPDPVADVAYARRLLGETCATCRHARLLDAKPSNGSRHLCAHPAMEAASHAAGSMLPTLWNGLAMFCPLHEPQPEGDSAGLLHDRLGPSSGRLRSSRLVTRAITRPDATETS